MDIYFFIFILVVINRLIVDTQTSISGIYLFTNEREVIHIWIRP